MSVRVEPGSAPGQALIRVPGAAGTAPGFRVGREDYEDGMLGPEGWQSSDAVLQPGRTEDAGRDLVLHVGWSVCRHLEAGMYTFALAAAGGGPEAVFWPDVAPLHAGAVDVLAPLAGPVPAALKPVVAAVPAASVLPPPRPVPAAVVPAVLPAPPVVPKGRGDLAIVFGLLGLLVLLAVGGSAWWWTHREPPVVEARVDPPVAPPVTPPTEPPVQPATPPAPPSTPPEPPATTPPVTPPPTMPPAPLQLGGLSVPDVLARAPNPAAVTAEGRRRLRGDRRDDGLLLLEAAADRGDGDAAAELGRLYDPVGFQPGGPIPRADPRQAARYYRDAARANVDVGAARDALKRSLDARAASGDLAATLMLKDFWP